MQNKMLTVEEFKARFDNSFQIQTSRWETDCALWLKEAIDDLALPRAFPIFDVSTNVTNYSCNIPPATLLLGIIYNDNPLTRVDRIDPTKHSFIANSSSFYERLVLVPTETSFTYQVVTGKIEYSQDLVYAFGNNNTIDFTFEEDTVRLIYHSYVDGNGDIWIPDVHSFIEACKFYVLRKLFHYGYKHNVFTLDGNNPYTNVNILYEGVDGRGGFKRRALNDATVIDSIARMELAGMNQITTAVKYNNLYPYKHVR